MTLILTLPPKVSKNCLTDDRVVSLRGEKEGGGGFGTVPVPEVN